MPIPMMAVRREVVDQSEGKQQKGDHDWPLYDVRSQPEGFTEGGHAFEEETVVRDLALQGALISMQHCPRLQSELQITMETPGVDGPKAMKMRGYVVRIETSEEKGHSAVGVVFTE